MQKIIQNLFSKRISKAIVDILLIIGLVITLITSRSAESSWWSFHCVASMIWYLLMIAHIWQHWKMIKALTKWKVLKRNKITFLTVIFFILLTFSIILFMIDVSEQFVHIYHTITSPLRLVIIIHLVTKVKRFVSLFK
jgi:hypothetical protein